MADKKPRNVNDLESELHNPSNKPQSTDTPEKEILYVDSVVAFIDLMGYANKIEGLGDDSAKAEILKLEKIIDTIIEKPRSKNVEVKYFSDCICISEQLPEGSAEEYLDTIFYFLLDLIHIQGEFLHHEVLLRGGVSIGRHYVSDRLIFSKALLKAYKVESKKAINPVIMLDESVYEKLVSYHETNPGGYFSEHHYTGKVNSLLSLSIQTAEGDHILNYLSFWRELDHPSYILPFLKKHKFIIEGSAEEYKSSYKILSKYKWMAEYHNFFIEKVLEINSDFKDELNINIDDTFGGFSVPAIDE